MPVPPDDADPPDPFRFDCDERDAREDGARRSGLEAGGPHRPDRPAPHPRPEDVTSSDLLSTDGASPGRHPEDRDPSGRSPDRDRRVRISGPPLGGERLAGRPLAGLPEWAARRADDAGGGWLLSVLGVSVAIVLVIFIVGRRDEPVATLEVGGRFPTFAAPLADRPRLEFDAVNLAERDDQGELGSVAACSVRSPSVRTSCDLLARGPLIVVLYAAGDPRCVRAADALQRLDTGRSPVGRLAVAGEGEHGETARVARARGWTMPVVYDRDGALSRRLGAPDCAATFAVRRDGRVAARRDGVPRASELAAMVRLLATRS